MRGRAANDGAKRWIILRMAGPRTLPVVESLNSDDIPGWTPIGAWTPVIKVKRRKHRAAKAKEEIDVALLTTFAFAPSDRLADLLRAMAMPVSPHPAFSIFRWAGEVPLIGDKDMKALRLAEERARIDHLKSARREFVAGEAIRVTEGLLEGATGVVEKGGKTPLVNLGGGWVLKIEGWLIQHDDVDQPKAPMAIAA